MNGQWIGSYSGTNTGTIVADLDDVGTNYAGVVFGYENNLGAPRTFAHVEIPKGKATFSLRAGLVHSERGSGSLVTPESLAQKFPGVQMPTHADTEWEVTPNQISLKWKTNIGTNGEGRMVKSEGQNPSLLIPRPDVKTWEDFKRFVLALQPYRFAFRGHENSTWRLRTAFHRTGRASLLKFMIQDVPALHRHLSGLTTHHFDLSDPLDYAAFLNLVQHHGYPTPILDWTHSPFVAAYFAFKDLRRKNLEANQMVRILILDAQEWATKYERAQVLMPGFLHMTMLEPLTTNNPRVLPQQSISSVTNVDDLETYVAGFEKRVGKSYLSAIDLPVGERRTVMQDLALMGITAGSLFPGLDGACLQLKERFFDL
jgi:FRG domain